MNTLQLAMAEAEAKFRNGCLPHPESKARTPYSSIELFAGCGGLRDKHRPATAGQAGHRNRTGKRIRNRYTFVDLFAGVGGFHLALAESGMKCVFASELDAHARQTYAANFDTTSIPFAGDITQVDPASVPDHDILCGGFPCQPFSVAGKRRGFNDERRGNLFFEILRIADAKRPRVLFLENVRGLVNHDEGRTFATTRNEIERRGYSFNAEIIKATDFNLPQHRPRVYIVAFDRKRVPNCDDFRFPAPVPLTQTMSGVWGGRCTRSIGFTLRCG